MKAVTNLFNEIARIILRDISSFDTEKGLTLMAMKNDFYKVLPAVPKSISQLRDRRYRVVR